MRSPEAGRTLVPVSATALSRAAAGVLLACALAGCGGDDEETGATTATTGAQAGSMQPENKRLSQAGWEEYVTTRDQAQAVNEAAIKTFRSCRKLVGTSVAVEKVEKCFGTATVDVVDESEKVIATLDRLAGETAGACSKAGDTLAGYVKLYASSVQAIGLGIQRADLPSPNDFDNTLEVLRGTRAANAAFERACKPV
jgi:hypothetical protein